MLEGYYKPYDSKFTNNIEIYSNFIILLISDNLILFTDYVDGNENKFNSGWIMFNLITLLIIGCITIILMNLHWSTKLIYLKKFKAKFEKCKEKIIEKFNNFKEYFKDKLKLYPNNDQK